MANPLRRFPAGRISGGALVKSNKYSQSQELAKLFFEAPTSGTTISCAVANAVASGNQASINVNYTSVIVTPVVGGLTTITQTSNAFNNVTINIGTAYASRRVIVVLGGIIAGGRTITSATIGGISATIHGQAEAGSFACVLSAVVPTGTTATLALTTSSTVFNSIMCQVYTVDDSTCGTPVVQTATTAAATSIGLTINQPLNGGGVVVAGFESGTAKTPYTYPSGYTQGDAVNANIATAYESTIPTGGSTSLSIGWSGSFTAAMVAVSWPYQSAGTTITCNLTTAAASGFQASVYNNLTVGCTLGSASGSGFAANVYQNVTINGSLTTANASGFQALVGNNVTLPTNLTTANASGNIANIIYSQIIACALSTATAEGFNARINSLIVGALGQANANGLTASVYNNLNIVCAQSVANATGNTASINYTIACTLGQANASGINAALLLNQTIFCSQGVAVANGNIANVRFDTVIFATPATANASGFTASFGNNIIITGALAQANALGYGATLFLNNLISCNRASADASGYPLSANVVIQTTPTTADASGTNAAFLSDRRMETQPAIADASGFRATVTGDGISMVIVDDDFVTFTRRIGRRR